MLTLYKYNITIRPITPPEGTIIRLSKDGETRIILTPGNILQVKRLCDKAIKERLKLDPEEVLQKVCKATCSAMAQSSIHNATNNELLELNRRKEGKANRTKGNWGTARVMNQEVIDQRKKDAAAKYTEKEVQKAIQDWKKEEKRLRGLV